MSYAKAFRQQCWYEEEEEDKEEDEEEKAVATGGGGGRVRGRGRGKEEEEEGRKREIYMVYHSAFNDSSGKYALACGCALPPLKGNSRGPAQEYVGEGMDIVDEVIFYFRAVVLFRTYDVQGAGDKMLIYLTMFVSQCLKRMASAVSRDEAAKQIASLLGDNSFKIPGDSGFLLGGLLSKPESKHEADMFRGYVRQAREQTGMRLLDKCFISGKPNKFWLAFHHRRFLGKDMNRVAL